MTLTAEAAAEDRLAGIIRQVSRQAEDSLAARFAEQLFLAADVAELESYAGSELAEIATKAFEAFRRRAPRDSKVLLRHSVLKNSEFLIADIVNDDMPFLLDSTVAQLHELGLVPELVAHPILEVRRDNSGKLLTLQPAREHSHAGQAESFIHFHIRHSGNGAQADEIERALSQVLGDVKTVVSSFDAMTNRIDLAIERLEQNPPPVAPEINAESIAFLRWLSANNFTFLGVRDYDYVGDRDTGQLVPSGCSGLGLLRDENMSMLRRSAEEPRLSPEIRTYFLNSPPVIVAKGNYKSTVHRRTHMDIIGIKKYGDDGRITGQLRVAGLFSASAYNLSTLDIPLVRLKADGVLKSSGYPFDSYSGHALLNVLETFPRDELFQISPGQLAKISEEVLKLDLTPRPRVFIRRDEFERFVSAFVYVPRDRFNTDVRVAIIKMLEEAFGGQLESFTPFFAESAVVRIHIVIWRSDSGLRHAQELDLEKNVEKIITTWSDIFRSKVLACYGAQGFELLDSYLHAFPAGYQEANSPERGLEDLRRLQKLGPDHRTDIDVYRPDAGDPLLLRATLQQLDEPLTLSRRVPILEDLGFDVVSERTFQLHPKMGSESRLVYLHDCDLRFSNGAEDIATRREDLERGFLAIWSGAAVNDHFNGLILRAGLDWRRAALFRAYAAYLRQTGLPYSMDYVSQVLNKHPAIASDLFSLFDVMFSPAAGGSTAELDEERTRIDERISAKLDNIPVLDDDRILRSLLSLINATLRTNFYQGGEQGPPETISLKFRSADIAWLPSPKPLAEIFVYSPRFQGIHLRGGRIARGGIRWSDRALDFRTEILSLEKAQQVKNVVIVPQGAKGGFVPRSMPKASRDALQAEGVACYKSFISSLLSITDNAVGGKVIPPDKTVRRDSDDPYLVVAADKGTAAFSDIANEISLSRNYWLGDAFASGGSAGYDHKKMGITARGAWEAVKRHFREMNADIQATPFTVAGIGDMSGDVFGNGMLMSKAIKLVVAFDHRDIFIDPDPDPAASWNERERLFNLPQSSWKDYNPSKISKGGGVFGRSEKIIRLSPEAQALLSVGPAVEPNELLKAILKAPVDLFWFGGIGTYIRSSLETDAQAGDKANDAIRIPASELNAKVAGEGANLGLTQKARIEFAQLGGKNNTDAIDNSAGVNTSDVEVNLKIALGEAVAEGKLDLNARNELLAAMTEEVAANVLRNNYLQTLAISLAERDGLADLGFQQRLMQRLETQDHLDRALESLPSGNAILERQKSGKPLTRPQLAVLLAYAKIDLDHDLINSTVPDDPYFHKTLTAYFPPLMRDRFAAEIAKHRLRREIIATSLTNDIINSGGPTFVVRLVEETGNSPADIAYAFAAVMAVYDVHRIYQDIDGLDGKIDGMVQLDLYRRVQSLLRTQTAWFLRHGLSEDSLAPEIARYCDGVKELASDLIEALPREAQARLHEEKHKLEESGTPTAIARGLAALGPLTQALDIVRVADAARVPIATAAKTVFAIRDAFHLDELAAASEEIASGDYFDRLAVNSSLATLASAQRRLAETVIAESSPDVDFRGWSKSNEGTASRVAKNLAAMLDGSQLSLAKLTVAVAQFRDLAAA